jgi:hypothetical protein
MSDASGNSFPDDRRAMSGTGDPIEPSVDVPPVQKKAANARRIVFFDVENSSRAEHVGRVLEYLRLDAHAERTKIVAMGNWRVVGPDTAELLSRRGAELVHSAPAARVKDWTDLRIAVAAGVWLGDARPGDMLDIVTDDQAFDAVGDVAASHGVLFRRVSHRRLVETGRAPAGSRRRRRHRPPHDAHRDR